MKSTIKSLSLLFLTSCGGAQEKPRLEDVADKTEKVSFEDSEWERVTKETLYHRMESIRDDSVKYVNYTGEGWGFEYYEDVEDDGILDYAGTGFHWATGTPYFTSRTKLYETILAKDLPMEEKNGN